MKLQKYPKELSTPPVSAMEKGHPILRRIIPLL
jgi:hypothetical protein